MVRWAVGVQYQGGGGSGWQKQPQVKTIQSQVEDALSSIAAESIETICAGRTDAGVHATGQVVHFDTKVVRPPHAWVLGGNKYLPDTIKLKWATTITDDFHARFSATARQYQYIIYNHPIQCPFYANRAWWIPQKKLCIESMHDAAKLWVGEQDFSSFRASACQAKHPRRRLFYIKVVRQGDLVKVTICANAFLHHMVRNILGVLVPIGEGRQPVSWAKTVLNGRSRQVAGITAPAYGLYLEKVYYPGYLAERIQHLDGDGLAEEEVFPYYNQ